MEAYYRHIDGKYTYLQFIPEFVDSFSAEL